MASYATTTRPGRLVRVVRHFLPSRRQLAFLLAAEAGITVLGAPTWLHLLAGVALHLSAWRRHERS
jgi:hypothetical protein